MKKINSEKLEKNYVKIDAKTNTEIDNYQHEVFKLQKEIHKLTGSDVLNQDMTLQIQKLSNELVLKMAILSKLLDEHKDFFNLTNDVFEK